jgi:outer membrane protein assembly factor BamA
MASKRVHVSFLVMMAFVLASTSLVGSTVLQAKPRKLARIDFVGNRFFEADALQKALRLVKPGDEWNPAMLEADIEMNLKGFLKERGFMRCELSVEDIEEDSEYVVVHIRVSEGKQYRLSELRLIESSVFSDEALISQFALRPGDIVNHSAIKQGLERIKGMYADQGYINMSYLPEQRFDESAGTVALKFRFIEEIPFTIDLVGFVGGEQAEEDEARSVVLVRPGGLFRPTALDGSIEALNKPRRFQELTAEDVIVTAVDNEKRSSADCVLAQAEASQMRLTRPLRREDARITKTRDARLRMLAPPYGPPAQ